MKLYNKPGFLMILLAFVFTAAFGQQEPSPFDFGKMWTFENPPKVGLKKPMIKTWTRHGSTRPNAALRFSSFCSAAFVSLTVW